MSELLILGIIVAAILLFFNRDWIKSRFFPDKQRNYTIDDQFNSEKREREKEIDHLLSKMGKTALMICLQKTEKGSMNCPENKKYLNQKNGIYNSTHKKCNGTECSEKCFKGYEYPV